MCRLNAKFALGQNVPYLFTNRIVGFILGETHAQSSLGSSLIIFSSFLFFRSLVKNDSLGNFDFNRQRHLDFSSNFEG